MEINKNYLLQNQLKPTFRGIPVAKARALCEDLGSDLVVYELGQKDRHFLKRLNESIDMKKLMPELAKEKYDSFYRWQEMLEIATREATNPNKKSFLAVFENKPCGLITFEPQKSKNKIDCIVKWPVEAGKNLKITGKLLFNQLFKFHQETKAKKLSLEAIINGPVDTEKVYSKIGFKRIGTHDNKIDMEITVDGVKNAMKKLQEYFDYKPIKNGTDENLLQRLDLASFAEGNLFVPKKKGKSMADKLDKILAG